MIVGIDLGTTNSLVGIWRHGPVALIPNALGDALTPSEGGLGDGPPVLVGRPAPQRPALGGWAGAAAGGGGGGGGARRRQLGGRRGFRRRDRGGVHGGPGSVGPPAGEIRRAAEQLADLRRAATPGRDGQAHAQLAGE